MEFFFRIIVENRFRERYRVIGYRMSKTQTFLRCPIMVGVSFRQFNELVNSPHFEIRFAGADYSDPELTKPNYTKYAFFKNGYKLPFPRFQMIVSTFNLFT